MPTGDAYSSGNLVPSLLDLHMFYLLRPILFPNLSLCFRTMLFEYPSVLSRLCFVSPSSTSLILYHFGVRMLKKHMIKHNLVGLVCFGHLRLEDLKWIGCSAQCPMVGCSNLLWWYRRMVTFCLSVLLLMVLTANTCCYILVCFDLLIGCVK